jgi:MT0933-like antitoxin protein
MALMRKLATLAAAGEAARRYAKRNPDQASRYLDQAAAFVDKQTKGKYSHQITGAAQKAKSAAGIRPGVVDGQVVPPPPAH